ncbi:MAG: hypothetical protein CVV30_01915 [Methanomicrobiales archaeon HGW-Methanomicrobiales-1]|jgi:hypothetical protein|nr:MAG: hypothetical protein CVV30_01915 [Methanomicrobiales archaeon HGW-Methanomicrobiales-1]
MQLPRGTFLKIKKSELISSILDELTHTKFSGICTVSSGSVGGTIVFKSGTCILAKIDQKQGDPAWEEIQKMSGQKADVALSSMDEAQIRLALEFNKTSHVIKAAKTAPAATHQPQQPSAVNHSGPAGKPIAPPVKADKTLPAHPRVVPTIRVVVPPLPTVTTKPAAHTPAQPITAKNPPTPVAPIAVHLQEQKKPAETDETSEDSSSFEKDIDTFETLDIDHMTDKIRTDCKTMIKQLQLEHLMER